MSKYSKPKEGEQSRAALHEFIDTLSDEECNFFFVLILKIGITSERQQHKKH